MDETRRFTEIPRRQFELSFGASVKDDACCSKSYAGNTTDGKWRCEVQRSNGDDDDAPENVEHGMRRGGHSIEHHEGSEIVGCVRNAIGQESHAEVSDIKVLSLSEACEVALEDSGSEESKYAKARHVIKQHNRGASGCAVRVLTLELLYKNGAQTEASVRGEHDDSSNGEDHASYVGTGGHGNAKDDGHQRNVGCYTFAFTQKGCRKKGSGNWFSGFDCLDEGSRRH